MASKKPTRKAPKAKRAAASSKPKATASSRSKGTTKALPIGDFTHSLYWAGSADKRNSHSLADQDVTHQLILVERTRGLFPNSDHKTYRIIGGSTAKAVIDLVSLKFRNGPYYEAEPNDDRVKLTIDDKFYQVVHVFYTDYYKHGVLVVPGGGNVKIFGPDTKLEVWAVNPPPL